MIFVTHLRIKQVQSAPGFNPAKLLTVVLIPKRGEPVSVLSTRNASLGSNGDLDLTH